MRAGSNGSMAPFRRRLSETPPVWRRSAYQACRKGPVKFRRRKHVKGFLFAAAVRPVAYCHPTGMPWSMNCPKAIAQRPLRAAFAPMAIARSNPTMPLRLGAAWTGSQQMLERPGHSETVQKPFDQSFARTSSWLRVTAQTAAPCLSCQSTEFRMSISTYPPALTCARSVARPFLPRTARARSPPRRVSRSPPSSTRPTAPIRKMFYNRAAHF